MHTKEEIIEFIKKCDLIYIVDRDKNAETRRRLGITVDDQEDLIKELTIHNYIKGPEADRDSNYPGDIWVFKKEAYGVAFYIKLKGLEVSDDGNLTRVISCHIAEYKFNAYGKGE